MKITPITRCANHECPNKPTEGTFTVTTINTREGRPRNITLSLCGPCADYLREAKDDAIKAAVAVPRSPEPEEYYFVGGSMNGLRKVLPHYMKTWEVAIAPNFSFATMREGDMSRPVPIERERYHRMAYRYHRDASVFVVESSVKAMYKGGWRVA